MASLPKSIQRTLESVELIVADVEFTWEGTSQIFRALDFSNEARNLIVFVEGEAARLDNWDENRPFSLLAARLIKLFKQQAKGYRLDGGLLVQCAWINITIIGDPVFDAIESRLGRREARIFSGGDADQLPARGELGANVRELVDSGRVTLVTGFAIAALRGESGRVVVEGETADGLRRIGPVDRIIAATGRRPDLSLTRELRLDLDPWLESAEALGSLIDPNRHSCGSAPPHGHRELAHPEPGFCTVGIKSYGRAPTFLLLTGYEQVRSVAAAIAGDVTAADDVRLVLPETGVCTTRPVVSTNETADCCGGPAPVKIDACCVADALAKDEGKAGCGRRAAA
jgi:hypothetical protein